MISFEILRERPKPSYPTLRDIRERVANRLSLLNPVSEAIEEEARLRRQHALAEGEKIEHLPPRFTNPNIPLWVPQAQQGKPVHGSWEETAIAMGKIPFNTWMNRIVYPKFNKGSLVTLRVNAFVVGVMPSPTWEVIDLQEIYYMANMDRELREPKVVGCWSYGTDKIPTYYPPSRLRTLQPEEAKVYNDFIRNKEAGRKQNGKSDDTRICGEDGCSPPADAGENS